MEILSSYENSNKAVNTEEQLSRKLDAILYSGLKDYRCSETELYYPYSDAFQDYDKEIHYIITNLIKDHVDIYKATYIDKCDFDIPAISIVCVKDDIIYNRIIYICDIFSTNSKKYNAFYKAQFPLTISK